jgi:hypothetical protein
MFDLKVGAPFPSSLPPSLCVWRLSTSQNPKENYLIFKLPVWPDLTTNNDVQGKAKYNKWQEFVEKKISQEDAEKQYIAKVEELKTKYGTK